MPNTQFGLLQPVDFAPAAAKAEAVSNRLALPAGLTAVTLFFATIFIRIHRVGAVDWLGTRVDPTKPSIRSAAWDHRPGSAAGSS